MNTEEKKTSTNNIYILSYLSVNLFLILVWLTVPSFRRQHQAGPLQAQRASQSTPLGILAFSQCSISNHLLPVTFLKLCLIVLRWDVRLGLDVIPQSISLLGQQYYFCCTLELKKYGRCEPMRCGHRHKGGGPCRSVERKLRDTLRKNLAFGDCRGL